MPSSDDIEADFRLAAQEVRGEPVHWRRVERRARRHRFTLLWRLVTIAVLVAAAVVGVKAAVDPAYRAQLSSATAAVTFGDEKAELGSTQLRRYLRETGTPAVRLTSASPLREEGFVFHATVDLVGLRRRPLHVGWELRSATTGRPAPVVVYPSATVLRPSANHVKANLSVWLSNPPKVGRYRVGFALRDARGRVLDRSTSHPFKVSTPRIATTYEAPGYVALLPSGWRFVERYKPAPPHRFVTKMVGEGLAVLIDTTRHIHGDPADDARALDAFDRRDPTYRRVELGRTSAIGVRAFEWSFVVEGRRKTDIFFYEGGDGYAVLAEGTPRRAAEIRAVARRVARSVQPRYAR